jgi:hypothetical protein
MIRDIKDDAALQSASVFLYVTLPAYSLTNPLKKKMLEVVDPADARSP